MKITIEINDIEELSQLKKMLDHVFDNECKDGIDLNLRLKDKDVPIGPELLNISIKKCDLTVRSMNLLIDDHIETLGDLIKVTEHQLKRIPNMGYKSLTEIKAMLEKKGLTLGQSEIN